MRITHANCQQTLVLRETVTRHQTFASQGTEHSVHIISLRFTAAPLVSGFFGPLLTNAEADHLKGQVTCPESCF